MEYHERGWRDRTEVMWGTYTKKSLLTPTQKWFTRMTQLLPFISKTFLLDEDAAIYEQKFRLLDPNVNHHNVYSVLGASMVMKPERQGWEFSVEKFKRFMKEWENPSLADRQNRILPYLREHTSPFQILVYVKLLASI